MPRSAVSRGLISLLVPMAKPLGIVKEVPENETAIPFVEAIVASGVVTEAVGDVTGVKLKLHARVIHTVAINQVDFTALLFIEELLKLLPIMMKPTLFGSEKCQCVRSPIRPHRCD